VRAHLAAQGVAAQVEAAPLAADRHRIRWPRPDPLPLVSVVVPTRDRAALLERCLGGLLHRTDYAPLEVLVVDNGSEDAATHALFDRLRRDPRLRILPAPGPFNFAALNNRAAAEARGEILLLLNNDIDVIAPSWLEEMVAHAVRPEVGAVGAKLLYANDRLQHGGTVLGIGVADHLLTGSRRADPGPHGLLAAGRGASAVTAACLALRRSVYEAVGGMDAENLAVAFNDVDLCLRIGARGLRVVWTPFAELHHLESASRGVDLTGTKAERFRREEAYMHARWGALLRADPYWNPNLSLADAARNLAWPPRREKPWRRHPPP
jgi:GT2 family glycosyltransferase